MSEFKPTSKPGLKGFLKRCWLFIKALVGVLLAWLVSIIARVIIAAAMLLLAVVIAGYLIIYGTRNAGEVVEMIANSVKKYRI